MKTFLNQLLVLNLRTEFQRSLPADALPLVFGIGSSSSNFGKKKKSLATALLPIVRAYKSKNATRSTPLTNVYILRHEPTPL